MTTTPVTTTQMTATQMTATQVTTTRMTRWTAVCRHDDLLPERGVCALVAGEQVAVFRTWTGEVYAVGNYDPIGRAYVLSRGIVGSRGDAPVVASPLFKQAYDLRTGRCLDDPQVAVPVFPVRRRGDLIEVGWGP